jgi:hypothetical protein
MEEGLRKNVVFENVSEIPKLKHNGSQIVMRSTLRYITMLNAMSISKSIGVLFV